MFRNTLIITISSLFLLLSTSVHAVPPVTGNPIIVQHLGKLDWPQDDAVTTPYLTQLSANDINDLHGDVSCDLIITTPGNYHMALLDAMKGDASLGHPTGLQETLKTDHDVTVCWSTSPPVSLDQIPNADLQFKNIHLKGHPALAMGPGKVMNNLLSGGHVIDGTNQAFLVNRGNVILVRIDNTIRINNVCDLGGNTRVVTPHPTLESGSFGNFSGTIFNVADQNDFGCDATTLFNGIFSQDAASIDTSSFDNPYDIAKVLKVFNLGANSPRWVASSRIMHRDVPYALCHDEADAGVIFYHQAIYLKEKLGETGCPLEIVPLGGTEEAPAPLPGNKIGTLYIGKVTGSFPPKVLAARNVVYNFLTSSSSAWPAILNAHGMDAP